MAGGEEETKRVGERSSNVRRERCGRVFESGLHSSVGGGEGDGDDLAASMATGFGQRGLRWKIN